MHRVGAGLQHLLVDREQQRLGGGVAVDRHDLALLHLRRVADEDLRQAFSPRVSHLFASSCARFRASVVIAMNSACSRESSVSSGWNAVARTRPSRIATGCPSYSARTSTPAPTRSTQGARMKIARRGSSPIPSIARSASKLCSWRPKALRRAVASIRSRWASSQTISPGAGSEYRQPVPCWPPGSGPRAPLGAHALDDRRALAARDDQAVETLELRRDPNLAGVGAEAAQHPDVGLEPSLDREDADPKRQAPRSWRSASAAASSEISSPGIASPSPIDAAATRSGSL